MAKRTGRPPSDNPKTERLFIRVTPLEKAEIQEHSKKNRLLAFGLDPQRHRSDKKIK